MNKRCLIRLGLAGLLLLQCQQALALEWYPELEQGSAYREPMQSFRIHIPKNVPTSVLQTLVLELDNIDVTAMVTRDGEYAVFTPIQPLEFGKHVLRLVEYAADGSINEKGYWEVSVRRSSLFREVDYAADTNLSLTQRLDAHNKPPLADEPKAFNAQGSASLQGRVADNDWEVTGQMDLIYNSEPDQNPHNDQLEMGQFLVTGTKKDNQLRLGHQTLAQTSLIMQGFNRRGVSATTGFSSLRSSATGFILRANEISGFRQGLGVSDDNNRVSGVIWETQPIKDHPQELYLSASLINGKKDLPSENTTEAASAQETSAWALVADSTTLDQQLRIRGEFAASNVYDITADTTDQDIVNADDNAMSLSLAYTPQASEGSQFYWNTGAEFRKVDTYFFSLANPNLPSDKKLNKVYFNMDWLGISTQLSTAKETDNVDKLEDRPTIETTTNQVSLNYSLNQPPKPGSWLNTLGVPSISYLYGVSDQQMIKQAITVTYADLDYTTTSQQLQLGFNKETWSWVLGVSKADQENGIDPSQNQNTRSTQLNANIQAGQHLTFTPGIQKDTTHLDYDDSQAESTIYNLGTQLLITDTISGNLTLNQTKSSSDSVAQPAESDLNTVTMQFTWNWIQAKNFSPGFDVSLSGSWQKNDDKIDDNNDTDNYQVFLSLVMRLPVSSVE